MLDLLNRKTGSCVQPERQGVSRVTAPGARVELVLCHLTDIAESAQKQTLATSRSMIHYVWLTKGVLERDFSLRRQLLYTYVVYFEPSCAS